MGGKQITLENFAAGAMFQATLSNKDTAFGFTQIGPEIYEGREFRGMCQEKQPDKNGSFMTKRVKESLKHLLKITNHLFTTFKVSSKLGQ